MRPFCNPWATEYANQVAGYSLRTFGRIRVNHGKRITIKSPRQRKITYGSMGRRVRSMLILAAMVDSDLPVDPHSFPAEVFRGR